MKVSICICTYRRPVMLDDLLTSIEQLKPADCDLRLVVVDNDPTESARDVVDRHQSLSVNYDVEPMRSIAAARNRSVAQALLSNPDVVVFLDDDQYVHPDWLVELLGAFRMFDAHAVAGPVLPRFAASVPEWLRAGGFYTRQSHVTGTQICPSGIANFGIRGEQLERFSQPFATHFKNGGEDTHFLRRMSQRCGDPYWCHEAVVFEMVTRERGTVRWLLARSFRAGRIYSEYLRLAATSRRRMTLRALTCCVRILQGVASLPLSVLRGRAALVRSCRQTCVGMGGLLGLVTVIE